MKQFNEDIKNVDVNIKFSCGNGTPQLEMDNVALIYCPVCGEYVGQTSNEVVPYRELFYEASCAYEEEDQIPCYYVYNVFCNEIDRGSYRKCFISVVDNTERSKSAEFCAIPITNELVPQKYRSEDYAKTWVAFDHALRDDEEIAQTDWYDETEENYISGKKKLFED